MTSLCVCGCGPAEFEIFDNEGAEYEDSDEEEYCKDYDHGVEFTGSCGAIFGV